MSAVFSAGDLVEATGGFWRGGVLPCGAIHGVSTDSRADVSGRLFIAIRGDQHDGHGYVGSALSGGASCVMVDREAELSEEDLPALVVDDTVVAMGRLASWHRSRLTGTTVVGITGSCGKTTTKHLLDSVLGVSMQGVAAERSFNNSIGVPLTLLRASADDAYVIVEIGTNAPGEVGALAAMARPDVSVVHVLSRRIWRGSVRLRRLVGRSHRFTDPGRVIHLRAVRRWIECRRRRCRRTSSVSDGRRMTMYRWHRWVWLAG